MKNVYLVGMPGSGKSTVGRLLSERLRVAFLDLDARIEADAGRTIDAIYASDGEEAFRELEQGALADVIATSDTVVSCGGGVVLRPENRERLKAAGRVVWLDVPSAVLDARVKHEPRGRPIVTMTESLGPVAEERRPLYREVSTMIVDADRAPADVASDVARLLS